MTRIAPAIALVIALACGMCWASHNPNAKVAIHIKSHNAKQTCNSLPAISDSSEIRTTYEGSNFDFFPVFFNLTEYLGVEYGVAWPAWAYSCAFTSCSDLVIGDVNWSGEGVSHAWTDCQYGAVGMPGWGWLYADSAGMICIIDHPDANAINVLDCHEGLDEPVDNFCAGVYGGVGDDPCARGTGEGDGENQGDLPGLRIAQVIEVTDGSVYYMQPVWSPDGEKLAFTKSGFTGVYVRNADGSGPIQEVTPADYSGFRPMWTSDSKGLVLRTRTSVVGQRVTIIDVETGKVKTLVDRAEHPGQPTRNAYGDLTIDVDGEMMVLDPLAERLESMDGYYSAERPPSSDIRLEIDYRNRAMWVIAGDETRRTEFPHQVLLASLSPTRERVAFGQADANIYLSDLDGSSVINLGPGERWDWSWDGARLVYLSSIRQSEWDVIAADIYVAEADGRGVLQLTDTPEVVEDFPVWSPRGMRIAYSTHRDGKICVAVLEE